MGDFQRFIFCFYPSQDCFCKLIVKYWNSFDKGTTRYSQWEQTSLSQVLILSHQVMHQPFGKEKKATPSEWDFINKRRTVCCMQQCTEKEKEQICKIPRPCCDERTMAVETSLETYSVKSLCVHLEFEYFKSTFLSANVISPGTMGYCCWAMR